MALSGKSSTDGVSFFLPWWGSRAIQSHEAAMPEAPHPTSARLAGFVRGDLSRENNRAVVRHLLAGCQACSTALRPLLEQAR